MEDLDKERAFGCAFVNRHNKMIEDHIVRKITGMHRREMEEGGEIIHWNPKNNCYRFILLMSFHVSSQNANLLWSIFTAASSSVAPPTTRVDAYGQPEGESEEISGRSLGHSERGAEIQRMRGATWQKRSTAHGRSVPEKRMREKRLLKVSHSQQASYEWRIVRTDHSTENRPTKLIPPHRRGCVFMTKPINYF